MISFKEKDLKRFNFTISRQSYIMTSNSYKFEYLDDIIDSVKNPNLLDIKDEIQNYDPGLNKMMFRKKFTTREGKKKVKNVPVYFYSSITRIRDAITGQFTDYMVGSRYEKNFFKVKNCSCLNSQSVNREHSLFFSSPEDFEKIFNVTLDTSVKEKWHKRQVSKEF